MKPGAARPQPLLRQWGTLFALIGIAVCAAVWNGWLWREDLLIYDAGLTYGTAPTDIVIVAIDDTSLAQIGRWPWRRAVHAALLGRLRAAGARAVALDIVFSEPDPVSPQDDALLAAALRAGPPTALPLIVDWHAANRQPREILPIAPLAQAAAALAHAHLEIDRDGIARSVFLREGIGAANRPHLSLALLEAARHRPLIDLPGARAPEGAIPTNVWARDYRILIPFLGPPGRFEHLSYVDVLRGAVPDSALRGKFVLVGATAQGLGDAYPTPTSGEGVAMPGVEISANVLHALRTNHTIKPASLLPCLALSLLPLGAGFLGFLRLSPRNALALIILLCAATLAFSAAALRIAYWWWPPSAALAGLALAYPLWSWRRLEATQGYLDDEMARLDQEPLPFAGALPPESGPPRFSDALQGRIERVRDATARLRHLRKLLSATIGALPDALLLVDDQGVIVMANPQAATLFEAPSAIALEGQRVDTHLGPLLAAHGSDYSTLALSAPTSLELRHRSGRELMLRVVEFHDGNGDRAGSVLDIADVSVLKGAERERDDMIRFLSHDLRSPSSSLLGLAQMLRDPACVLPPAQTASRIESLAGRTLALADGFIALARAQFISAARFEIVDLHDALQDALDEVWAAAQARQIRLSLRPLNLTPCVRGERDMLSRAFVNLLSNAIKYSPANGEVTLAIERRGLSWTLSISDAGPGIPQERQHELFHRFRRIVHAGEADPGGTGLGLAFVRVVADKHHGGVSVESRTEGGARFIFSVPAYLEP